MLNTILTIGQICQLSGIASGKPVGRPATKDRAVAKLWDSLVARVGEGAGDLHKIILESTSCETALIKLKEALIKPDRDRGQSTNRLEATTINGMGQEMIPSLQQKEAAMDNDTMLPNDTKNADGQPIGLSKKEVAAMTKAAKQLEAAERKEIADRTKAEAKAARDATKAERDAAKAEKAEKAQTKPTPRISGLSGMTLNVGSAVKNDEDGTPHNPRKPGTHGWRSMAIIIANPGIYFEDYLKAGGRTNDLKWDIDHDHAQAS